MTDRSEWVEAICVARFPTWDNLDMMTKHMLRQQAEFWSATSEPLILADEREQWATHEAVQSSHIGMLLREAVTMTPDLYAQLEEAGITRERLRVALQAPEAWGSMVHAFEFLTVLSKVLNGWPEEKS